MLNKEIVFSFDENEGLLKQLFEESETIGMVYFGYNYVEIFGCEEIETKKQTDIPHA